MLRGFSVCDSFATGSPVGTNPFSFLLAPSVLPPVASSGIFVGSSLVFILLSVSGFHPLPSPFRLDSFLSFFRLWVVVPSIFSSFSLRSDFLGSPSWAFCFATFDSEDCFFPIVSPAFLVSFLFFHCFLPLHVEWCLPLRSYGTLLSLCSSGSSPLLPSWVPPWDLSRVLSFLRGPPFEPVSSCSLRDLSRKVLFLVSLAMARRVGELPVVSAVVSSSGGSLLVLPS